MGVKSLWQILFESSKVTQLEELCNMVLAIDISIWLNQILKAMRDRDGNRIDNAHIVSLYHRICKLLFYNIKPIFVFDGAVPFIKLKTTALRRQVRKKAAKIAYEQSKEKMSLKLQKIALQQIQGKKLGFKQSKSKEVKDIFYLDDMDREIKDEDIHFDLPKPKLEYGYQREIIDPDSEDFKQLPKKLQYELLCDHIDYVKYSAKANHYSGDSASNSFSNFQINNLLGKNDLTAKLKQLRHDLNQEKPGVTKEKQGTHSVHIVSTADTEIVFTKKINNSHFEIINTQKPELEIDSSKEDEKSEVIEDTKAAKNETDLKDLFFKSDTEEEESEDEKVDGNVDTVKTNVFGLKQGHPGSFINPFKRFDNNVKNMPSAPILLKVPDNELMNVSSSEASDDEAELSQSSVTSVEPTDNEISSIQKQSDTTGDTVIEKTEEKLICDPSAPLFNETSNDVSENVIIDKKEWHSEGSEELNIKKAEPKEKEHSIADKADEFIKKVENINSGSELVLLADETEQQLEIMKLKQKKNMAVSETVSEAVIRDVKELLRLFGLPWITAPAEAEAQCAALYTSKLCDGVITDDSDVFLFADEVVVYRNMFKKDKDITSYRTSTIKEVLGLDRRQMIDIAELTGSDYFAGVPGIGGVRALDILRNHASLDAFINKIRDRSVDKKYLKYDFSGIPNVEAKEAYLKPSVQISSEEFSWKPPDTMLIKEFLNRTIGWDSARIEESLRPIVDKDKSRNVITNYFTKSREPIRRTSIPSTSQKKLVKKRKLNKKNVVASKKTKFSISSEESDS